MNPSEEPPSPRYPRRGDIVRSSSGMPAVSGVVVSVRAGKIAVDDPVQGRLIFTETRMSWKAKAKCWLVYPQNLPRLFDLLDQCETRLAQMGIGDTPRLGDRVQVADACGWVVELHSRAQPSERDPGMVFSVLDRVEVSLRRNGQMLPRSVVDWSHMRFDGKNSIWRYE